MKIIGLTGSIAMGKTEVVKVIRDLGIPVFDADAEVRKLYASKEGADLLRTIAPEATTNSMVERTILSRMITQDPDLLPRIERLVHPHVTRMRNDFLEHARRNTNQIVVLDIPLLFEKTLKSNFDAVIVVSAPEALQRQRALARPGMTQEKLNLILSHQMTDAAKRKQADHIIDNNGSLDDLRHKTITIINKIRGT